MTLVRNTNGLLLRTPGGKLTHDLQCCCSQADCAVCTTDSVPESMSVTVSGMVGAFGQCAFCETEVNGEIEHGYLRCDRTDDGIVAFVFEDYEQSLFALNCGSYNMIRRVNVFYYMRPAGNYLAYSLRATYGVEFEFVGFPPGYFAWRWDNAVVAYGGHPFDCTTLFGLIDFGNNPSRPNGGPCDVFANPTLSYVVG